MDVLLYFAGLILSEPMTQAAGLTTGLLLLLWLAVSIFRFFYININSNA